MHRKEEGIGPIGFSWGTPGTRSARKGAHGLSHVIDKHGIEVMEDVVEAIARGTAVGQGPGRIAFDYNRHRAVIKKFKDPNTGQQLWVVDDYQFLSGFKKSTKQENVDRPFDLTKITGPIFYRGKN